MSRIYVIRRIDFDSLENREPLTGKLIGYALSEGDAAAAISEAIKAERQYRGWDGETYPKFTATPLDPIGGAATPKKET